MAFRREGGPKGVWFIAVTLLYVPSRSLDADVLHRAVSESIQLEVCSENGGMIS